MQPFAADLAGTPPVGSALWWKRPERFGLTGDPDTDTARTVAIMCDHIKGGAADPVVQQYAQQAAQQFAAVAGESGPGALAACAWWWCKTYIKFVHHESLLQKHLGEAGHLQGLISPDALVRMSKPQGDCAIFTDMLCAFLRVFGIKYEIVTVAVNPREPSEYSHVFAYAVLPDGRRLPLDASHGDYPGWQVPSAHVFRRQVWDEDGNPVSDRGSRFDGLHGYGLRGFGLGVYVCDESGCYDDGSGGPSYDPTPDPFSGPSQCVYGFEAACSPAGSNPTLGENPIPGQGGCTCIGGTCMENGNSCGSAAPPTTRITMPSQSSSQWANIIAGLTKAGVAVAQIQQLKPGMVINPNGQLIYQNPGYSVNTGGTVGSAAVLGSSLSSMLPWLLGGGILLMVAGMAGKR